MVEVVHSSAGANKGCTVLFGNGVWYHSISCQCMTIIACISCIMGHSDHGRGSVED